MIYIVSGISLINICKYTTQNNKNLLNKFHIQNT